MKRNTSIGWGKLSVFVLLSIFLIIYFISLSQSTTDIEVLENNSDGEKSETWDSIVPELTTQPITVDEDCWGAAEFDSLCSTMIDYANRYSEQNDSALDKTHQAYKALLSHEQDTLFFSFCHLYSHINDLSLEGEFNKAQLSYSLIQDILMEDSFWQDIHQPFNHFESHSTQMLYTYRAIYDRYQNHGEKWLLETSPGTFQLIRATKYVPALRLLQTQCTGDVYNTAILHHAHEAFGWCFYGTEHSANNMLADGKLPSPPENVANEDTQWILTQQNTGVVTLSFFDTSNDFLIGRMVYSPSDSELDDAIDYTDKYGVLEVEIFQ